MQSLQIQPSTEPGFDLKSSFHTPEENKYIDAAHNSNEDQMKDKQRYMPFIHAINRNKHLFKDKIVLDINCGLGVLSILAAKAGAKAVYGVEPSSVYHLTLQVVKENGLEDIVTLFNGKIEEVNLPNKVDIIICQWMGYFVLFEDSIEQVLFARDRYLNQNGMIFPDRAVLFLAAIEDEEYRDKKLSFWNKVYGVNMSCMHEWVIREAQIEKINEKQVVSDSCAVYELDMYKVNREDLDFSHAFKLPINRNDYIHGLVGWFEVYFTECHIPIRMSCAPFAKSINWKQTVFYIKETIAVHRDDILRGSIALKKQKKHLEILVSLHLENKSGKWDVLQNYRMN